MKLTMKTKDIPQILTAVEKIREHESHLIPQLGMHTSADPLEVIHKLKFIEKSNKVSYCPNGLTYSWGEVANEIQLTYEEYSVVVLILGIARNLREGKDIWSLLA